MTVTRLEVAHGRRKQQIEQQTVIAVRRAWVAADGRDEATFVREAAAVEQAARSAMVAETDAFLAAYLTGSGATATVRGLDPAVYARPVDTEVLWRRPFVHMRTKLADGMEVPQALAFGRTIASTLASTNLQYAARGAARDWMEGDNRIVGYRRVLGSGGASGENCGLCIVASTQRYRKGDLLPIHDNCTCSVAPVLGTEEPGRYGGSWASVPGQVWEDLDAFDGQYSVRNDLGRVRIDASELPRPAVFEHGELGPVIYDSSYKPPLLDAAA